jgi:hypothetical protein
MSPLLPSWWNLLPVALLIAGLAYALRIRPWHLRWGTTVAERLETLPGDNLTPEPTGSAEHAITIYAPVAQVWPWLVQIGRDKGGFYSYAWLENLVGCRLHNADRILPAFQHLEVGDVVWLHPLAPPLPVEILEPERCIVLGSNTDQPGTWGFYLKEVDERTTRLLIRSRGTLKPGLLSRLGYYLVFEPCHFLMERKMLLGIKHRAEAIAGRTGEPKGVLPLEVR